MSTIHEFIAKYGITADVVGITHRSDDCADVWSNDAQHWSVRLQMPHGRPVDIEFSQGSAHKEPPTAADVLDCLASDASGVEDDFETWAENFGHDTDSRKAERIYNAVKAQTEQLRILLRRSDACFNELVNEIERL
jgi:hypothetical protein